MTEERPAYVTLARFWETSQPLFLKSVLEAHGIEAFITGEYLGNISGTIGLFSGQTQGGIELRVHADDAEEAEAILSGAADAESDEELPDAGEDEEAT